MIGDPVSHSLSPAIHNAAFCTLGLDYIYVAFRVTDCRGAIQGFRAFDQLLGLSVTIPHKIQVCQYLDWIDEVALKIGSVNTIVKDDGILRGYNTDGIGALNALREADIDAQDKEVLILGSGGVSRAIAFSLLMSDKSPSKMNIIGIDEEQCKGLASDLKSLKRAEVYYRIINDSNLAEGVENASLLINCTPIGMWPDIDKTIVPEGLLHRDLAVFDVIYNPLKTRLIRNAQEKGCKVVSGLSMFISQAAGQFELWTKKRAPFEIMKQKAMEYLRK